MQHSSNKMFVNSNKEADLKKYFRSKLAENFSENEIKFMYQELLQKRMKMSRQDLMLAEELRFSESDLLYFRTIIKQLQQNVPFQHLLGESFFCDLVLDCDARALIPRPETEELVYWIIEDNKQEQKLKIIDICTGSGCIALALKKQLPQAQVLGIDVSAGALALAQQNVQKTRLEVSLQQSDVLQDWKIEGLKEYNCWVSNPPYIPEKDSKQMHTNVLEHEPHLALFVPDNDALLFYRIIAQKAMQVMNPEGRIYFEIHENYALQVTELLVSLGFKNPEIKTDMQGKQRMIKARK